MFQILSLEQQSLVKIADVLWNEECINRVVTDCGFNYYHEKWIENSISKEMSISIAKVHNLFLPCIIEKKLLYIIEKVGLQKINWYFYHEKQWSIRRLPKVFYRTSWGTIDRKKTAESLVMDNTVDICERYSLACCYCFEKEILNLSKEIPQRVKKLLTHTAFGFRTTFEDGEIVKFWNIITEYERLEFNQRNRTNIAGVQQETRDNCLAEISLKKKKIYRRAFLYALETSNNVAIEYFYGKLLKMEPSDAAKLHTLLEKMCVYHQSDDWGPYRPLEYYIETTFFLLRQMTKDQQIKALGSDRDRAIELYLRWPFQSLFSQYVKTFFCPMSPKDLVQVLNDILCSSERDIYKVFNYQDPFTQFWHEFSASQKQDIVNCLLRDVDILSSLIRHGYHEVFMLLNSLTSTQKKKFLFSKRGMELCESVAEMKAWNSLKLLFETTLSSRVFLTKFKIKFKSFLAENKYVNSTKILDILSECKNNLRH